MRTVHGPISPDADRSETADRENAGRVAVVFHSGKAGSAALREAAELSSSGSELWVVTLAPQAERARCCRSQCEGPYNIAVKEEAERELAEARYDLGSLSERATFEVLAGCPRPPLAAWVAERGIGLVLLPHTRLTLGGSPFARSLRKRTRAVVRVV